MGGTRSSGATTAGGPQTFQSVEDRVIRELAGITEYRERGVMLGPDGTVLHDEWGPPEDADGNVHATFPHDKFVPGAVVYHNHPGLSPFSEGDVRAFNRSARDRGLAKMVAVSPTEVWELTTTKPLTAAEWNGRAVPAMDRHLKNARRAFSIKNRTTGTDMNLWVLKDFWARITAPGAAKPGVGSLKFDPQNSLKLGGS